MIYLNKDGFLLNDISHLTPFEAGFVDVTDEAYTYLNTNVNLLPGVTVRSVIDLVEKNDILQKILVKYNLEDFFKIKNCNVSGSNPTKIQKIKVCRSAEFNHYANMISFNEIPELLGYIEEEGKSVAYGLDFTNLESVLDTPLVLDFLVSAYSECLINSPCEQTDLYFNVPHFTLIEILEAIFSELNTNCLSDEDCCVGEDLVIENVVGGCHPANPLNLMGDGPHKGIIFSDDFKGNKNLVLNLIDALPNKVILSLLFKEVFGEKVLVKPQYEKCNAYEFRVMVYGVSKRNIPCERLIKKKYDGLAIRKDEHCFNDFLLAYLKELGCDVEKLNFVDFI